MYHWRSEANPGKSKKTHTHGTKKLFSNHIHIYIYLLLIIIMMLGCGMPSTFCEWKMNMILISNYINSYVAIYVTCCNILCLYLVVIKVSYIYDIYKYDDIDPPNRALYQWIPHLKTRFGNTHTLLLGKSYLIVFFRFVALAWVPSDEARSLPPPENPRYFRKTFFILSYYYILY